MEFPQFNGSLRVSAGGVGFKASIEGLNENSEMLAARIAWDRRKPKRNRHMARRIQPDRSACGCSPLNPRTLLNWGVWARLFQASRRPWRGTLASAYSCRVTGDTTTFV